MPRSKRSKLISLSKVEKRGKEFKTVCINNVHSLLDEFRFVWAVKIEHTRNRVIHEIRSDWKGSRLLYGKKTLFQIALGDSPLKEYVDNINEFTKTLVGNTHLLFTNEDPETVKAYFTAFSKPIFCRAKTTSPMDFTIPEGIVYSRGGQIPIEEDVPMPHNMEETLRTKYNIPTSIKAGKIILNEPFEVCKAGDKLDVKQALIMKQFGVAADQTVTKLISFFDKESSTVTTFDN